MYRSKAERQKYYETLSEEEQKIFSRIEVQVGMNGIIRSRAIGKFTEVYKGILAQLELKKEVFVVCQNESKGIEAASRLKDNGLEVKHEHIYHEGKFEGTKIFIV